MNMFSDNLKTMRNAKGYTQEELAIKLNVVRQTVSKWENFLCFEIALLHILCDREEKCYKLQKSTQRNDCYIDFCLLLEYNRIDKCNKLQKSFARRLYHGDSQRFLFG